MTNRSQFTIIKNYYDQVVSLAFIFTGYRDISARWIFPVKLFGLHLHFSIINPPVVTRRTSFRFLHSQHFFRIHFPNRPSN